MIEKTIHLSSPDKTLDIEVSMNCHEDFTDIDINGNIRFTLDKNQVMKAYLINEDLSEINLGVIRINYDRLSLKKRIPANSFAPKTILITKKDTSTEEECTVLTEYLSDDSIPDKSQKISYTPISHAKKILETIKNASESNDQGISKRNCINLLKRNLENMKSIPHSFRMFDTFYIIEQYQPIVNLSAIKFVMSESLCTYSFFETGHYLMAINENIILIAFRSFNGQNPLEHLEDLSLSFEISSETYFGVMIELSDEGQYFIL